MDYRPESVINRVQVRANGVNHILNFFVIFASQLHRIRRHEFLDEDQILAMIKMIVKNVSAITHVK